MVQNQQEPTIPNNCRQIMLNQWSIVRSSTVVTMTKNNREYDCQTPLAFLHDGYIIIY